MSQNEPAAPPHKRKERERTFAFLMQKMCEGGRRGSLIQLIQIGAAMVRRGEVVVVLGKMIRQLDAGF